MIYTTAPMSLMGSVYGPLAAGLSGALFLIFLWMFVWAEFDAGKICHLIFSVMILSILWISCESSLENYNNHNALINEPVEAYLVGQSEGVEARSTGKHSAGLFPVMHVQYKTPDGIVSFRKYDGVTYPEVAILYRNKQ